MDFTKPFLSGVAATIVGTFGLALAAISIAIPQPWGFWVGLVGFAASLISGMSARPPQMVEGAPKLQGTALVLAGSIGGLLVQYWPMIPVGWPQGLAMALAAVISWLTGKVLPQLGSTSIPTARIDLVGGARGAANLFNRVG